MRKIRVVILSFCLLMSFIAVIPVEKKSTTDSAVSLYNPDQDLKLTLIDSSTGHATIMESDIEDQIDGLNTLSSGTFLFISNRTLVAEAGENQTVYEGEVVQFNGSGSIGTGEISVLHVSVWEHDELQKIVDYTGTSDKFSVTQVSLSEFNLGNPSNLSSFDVIVFGLNNGYEINSIPIEREAELEDNVSNGVGIVWTHDSLELTYDYGPWLEDPAGVNFDPTLTQYVGLNIPNVEIIMDHDILHDPFEIGNVGDIISKTPYPPPWYHYAHTSKSSVTTAEIILHHVTTPGPLNFYLTTHEYGEGRVVVDEIGHTVISEDGTFLGIPSLKECQILVNAIYWAGRGGGTSDTLVYEWDFDANVDSDNDGNPTNDIEATGPTPTHTYGDDGVYTVTLTVTNKQNLSDTDTCNITVYNLDPNATIKSATMDVEIGLRVAGRKYNNVSMILYEVGNIIGQVSIERMSGSPNEQMAWIPITLDMIKTYNATVTYIPEDPPNIGSNPVWVYIKFGNGSIEKIHHTFNVQQSKKRNSDHWNHVEPWEVDINNHLIGHELSLEVTATDPGSDDLTFQWNSNTVATYYNNGLSPDPYPSPGGIFPFKVEDFICVPYTGPGSYTLTITDDDNGVTYESINLA